MAGSSATVGDQCAGTFHHRFPVRVCHVCYQHVTRLDQVHVSWVEHNAYWTHAYFLRYCAADYQWRGLVLIKLEGFRDVV